MSKQSSSPAKRRRVLILVYGIIALAIGVVIGACVYQKSQENENEKQKQKELDHQFPDLLDSITAKQEIIADYRTERVSFSVTLTRYIQLDRRVNRESAAYAIFKGLDAQLQNDPGKKDSIIARFDSDFKAEFGHPRDVNVPKW